MSGSDQPATPIPTSSNEDLGLVDALAQLSFVVHSALGRIAAGYDLSIVQLRLLGILRDRRPTINEIARVLQLDKSSVTGLIDRAEQRGLVRRTRSKVDRRSVHVTITATGKRLANEGTAAFGADVARLVTGLTVTQRRQLAKVAGSIVTVDAQRRGISPSFDG